MNETVIQEIADQLGMAVDQAGVFIQTYLPQYAMIKAINILIPMLIFTIILIIVYVIMYRSYRSYANNQIERGRTTTFKKYLDDNHYEAFLLVMGCTVMYIICFVLFIPEAIYWIMFPEVQLINDCISAIK